MTRSALRPTLRSMDFELWLKRPDREADPRLSRAEVGVTNLLPHKGHVGRAGLCSVCSLLGQ
jgi:hypothetical protein